jgi:hypothetical protein
VPWRLKGPIMLAVLVVSVIASSSFPSLSSLIRAVGVAVVVGWIAWVGEKGALPRRRVLMTLSWTAAALLASLGLDRIL